MLSRLVLAAFFAITASAQVSVLTDRYDINRTGTNFKEAVLSPSTVNSGGFGKVYSYPVDGSVYAQPLYVPNLSVSGTTHNVLFVETMNDTVYAFDADQNQTLWSVNFTNPAAGITPVPIADITGSNSLNIVGTVGIESTPVIDASTQTMYLVARTKEVSGSSTSYVQRLHALDIATGAEKFGGPVAITAAVPGTGEQSSGGMVPFNGKMNNQRPALALANGQILIAWASHEDDQPYHGWVMSYSASTLAQTGAFCDTPNGSEGGIWQSGRGPVIDAQGNAYYITGNGTVDSKGDFGEAVVRFSTASGLSLTDYFIASNANSLNNGDVDLGASGLLLLPKANLLIGGGKQGIFYLLNPANLGHFAAGDSQIPQKFQATSNRIKPGPAYWSSSSLGPLVYLWAESDFLKAFHFSGTTFDTAPLLQSTLKTPDGAPGATLAISANANTDASAIVWASMPISQDADHGIVPGMLRALNANDPTVELWNSQLNAVRDSTGYFAKFVPPLVVNGKVYMASFSDYATTNYVNVFGLLKPSAQFTLSASPSSATIRPGSAATYIISVNPPAGFVFKGSVSFSISGLPVGATATFNPPTVSGSSNASLSISTATSVALGSYPLVVTGTSRLGVQSKVPITLNVSDTSFTISMNFVGNGAILNPDDVAGVVPKGNWNNLDGFRSAAPQPLVDETGAATQAVATWAGQNAWALPIAGTPANFGMMQGYLDDQNGGTTVVSVSGLPPNPSGYQVYVYADGDNPNDTRVAAYTVAATGVPKSTLTLADKASVNFNGTFTEVTASNAAGNYMIFAVPGSGFVLTATPVSGTARRAPVNAIQIVPVGSN